MQAAVRVGFVVSLALSYLAFGAAPLLAKPPLELDHRRLDLYLDAKQTPLPIRTAEHWQQRRRSIIHGAERVMGPSPDLSQAPPLDVQVLEETVQEGIRRQTIAYVVEGKDRCTAYLWLPEVKPGERRAAILALHPTGPLGKGIVAGYSPRQYRQYGLELAQRGYIVLAPDYPSFGDLTDYNFATNPHVSGTMKGIVNHRRGIDYLVSRPDVDAQRIGAIGHSLGGHNAIFLGVFDDRVRAVVSSCGWCPFHDYYGGQLKGWTSDRYMPRIRDDFALDPDQVPFDFPELIAALAPRAFLSVSPLEDGNFDVRGVKKAIPEARKIYQLLGVEDRLEVLYPECGHDFPDAMRTAAYEFFDRHLEHTPVRRVP